MLIVGGDSVGSLFFFGRESFYGFFFCCYWLRLFNFGCLRNFCSIYVWESMVVRYGSNWLLYCVIVGEGDRELEGGCLSLRFFSLCFFCCFCWIIYWKWFIWILFLLFKCIDLILIVNLVFIFKGKDFLI